MAKRRVSSRILDTARDRVQGVKAFNPNFSFGEGLTLATVEALINSVRLQFDDYSQTGALYDEKTNILLAGEEELNDLSTRLLAAVGAQHGKDSSEYEMAGGTRQSEIRRKPRKPKTPPTE